ncbi:MAG TPA: glutathione S-transferase family protein [Chthoniobacterales bacterium]|nr:glutathione S-transferase family protein [Chthoniobacterales bacterium]
MPTITAFESSPDHGQGHARDMRVRWAFEEVGQPYEVDLRSFEALKQPKHLSLNPFGSIPTYEEGQLILFESGSIVLHIAERHEGLLPTDAYGRARALTRMFAALNTVEPPIVEREAFMLLEKAKPWFHDRLPLLEENIRNRLNRLSNYLGDREWLDGQFSAADLLMVTVLRRLESSNFPDACNIVEVFPNLSSYVERGKGRRAYKRAFEAQLAVFRAATDTQQRF